jgi:CRISPR/Cas system-associated protein Cas7 (RAMP superfamily)
MHAFPLIQARRKKELDYLLKMVEMNGYEKKVILKLSERNERKRK